MMRNFAGLGSTIFGGWRLAAGGWRLAAGGCVLAALSACGGGGGSTALISNISGKVIDGYIRGATVYWDCNNNNQLDVGEVSTITTAGGNYTIAEKTSVGCELLALVGADAIDESRPYTSGQSYTMKAVQGRTDLITPFSTLIAGQVSSTGVTAVKAEADIASFLGINSSVLVDYKANNVDPNSVKLATSAAVIADSLHQNQKNAIFTTGVSKTYDEIKARFAQTGFAASISRGLTPFINTYQSISTKLSKLVLGDTNLRLYRKVNFSDPVANNFLDAIALEVNSRNAAKYGVINWEAFSNNELKNYLKEIHRINALSSDSAAQSNIQAFQAKRQKLFFNASLKLNKVVGNDGELVGVYGFFTNDPGASIDFALEMVSISIDTAIDVATIAGTRPPIGRPSDYAKKHKSLNKMLDNFAFMTSAVKCDKASASIDNSEVDMTTKITSLIGDCGSFFADVAADARTIAISRDITQAASGAMTAIGGFGAAVDSKQKALMALKMYSTALGLVHDVAEPFVKDPITTRFLAAADLGIQYLNASVAGLELEIAATEKLDQGTSDAIALYEREIDSAWRSYFISFMQITADFHFEISDSTQVKPIVTGITPITAKSGATSTFTIAGRYLPPTDHLDITFNGCANIKFVSQSATQHQFSCTPNTAGTLTAVIRTTAGTTPLGSLPVLVSSTVSTPGIQPYPVPSTDARYAAVGGYPITSCVKDKLTGLIWEGKEDIGIRSGSITYNNFGDYRIGDSSEYLEYVNSIALCGFNDWRIPNTTELISLIDTTSGVYPSLNLSWFPNHFWNVAYWGQSSGTLYGNPSAFVVTFAPRGGWYGPVNDFYVGASYAVRLVH